jgi:diacylglycerol kinase family enzyme
VAKYPHIVVLENPKSTNAQSSQQYVAAIQEVCEDSTFERIKISADLPRTLAAHITDDTLLCILGGDGTMNSVVQVLLGEASLSAKQRRVPVLPLWGGNANDLAHMLNGRPSHEACQTIIETGNVLPIYPLRCTIKTEGKPVQTRYAICYVSFGATAHAAHELNKQVFRKNPLHNLPVGKIVSEAAVSLKALHDAPTFVVEHNGERKIVYDWIIGKGPRMAKLMRLPVALTDQTFYQGMVERKWLPDVAVRAASMAWGSLSPTKDKKPVTFTTTESIWAQFDGEPLRLPTHTKITISLSPKPFFALSTAVKSSATLKA